MAGSRRSPVSRAALPSASLALLLSLATTGSTAAPAAGDSLEDDIAAVERLMDRAKWKAGADALRQIFTDHENSVEIPAHLARIENHLKQCLFRMEVPERDPKTWFGKGVKKYDARKHTLELDYPKGPGGDHWVEEKPDQWRLDIRFKGDLKVNFEGEIRNTDEPRTPLLVMHWDGLTGEGYMLSGGMKTKATASEQGWKGMSRIELLGKVRKTLTEVEPPDTDVGNHKYEFERKGMLMSVKLDRRTTIKTSDKTLDSGMLIFLGWKIKDIRIKGTLDTDWWDALCKKSDDEARERWETNEWKRDREIPAWARRAAGDE